MPGMNYPSADAYGIIANLFYLYIFITGIAGLIIAVLWSYALPALGLDSKIKGALSRISFRSTEGIDADPTSRFRFIRITFGLMWLFDGFFQMRPDMPGGFTQQVIAPTLNGAPSWLISLSTPILSIWNSQPIKIDTVTAWLQIFIGLGFLLIRSHTFRSFVLYISIAWSVAVFVVGNGFGVFYSGASWLTGAPSAVIAYGFASIYLLAAQKKCKWTTDNRLLSVFIASFLTIGAFLQALPSEGYWSHFGNSRMIAEMAQAYQPHFIISSLRAVSVLAASQPTLFNLLMVILPLSAAAIVVVLNQNKNAIIYAIAVELIAWWIGMDFGIFSSTSTDFNSGLPIIILLMALTRTTKSNQVAELNVVSLDSQLPLENRYSIHAKTLLRFTFLSTIIAAFIALVSILGPASPAMAEVDSGGIHSLPPKSIPTFELKNYQGSQVTERILRGNKIILTFIDSSCNSQCLTTLSEISNAYHYLGGSSQRTVTVILNSDPTTSLKITSYNKQVLHLDPPHAPWYFLTGPKSTINKLRGEFLAAGGRRSLISPAAGKYQIYFIDKTGNLSKVLSDTGNKAIASSYSRLIAATVRSMP